MVVCSVSREPYCPSMSVRRSPFGRSPPPYAVVVVVVT
jgi:hypothetical protein